MKQMDEFEAAGFDEGICEKMREVCIETGIHPERLIALAREFPSELHGLSEYAQLETAWEKFKQALWDEFEKTKIHRLCVRVIERFRK